MKVLSRPSRNKSALLVLTAAFLALPLAGCLGQAGEGTVSVYVKDDPSDDFKNLFVTFDQVRVHKGAGGDDEDDGDAGWRILVDESREVDLLAYQADDSRAFLGDANISAGRYSTLEINVTQARGVDHDGEDVPITVSSGKLRLVRSFNVSEDETTRIILDFDLERPGVLVQQGPPGGDGPWRMTPVVGKIIVEEDAAGPEGDRSDDDPRSAATGGQDGTGTQGGQSTATSGAGPTGTLTTYIKDAATDHFTEIWVTIERVEVHLAPGSTMSDNETDDGSANGTDGNETNGGWIVVVDTPRTLDLMAFSEEDSKAFLGEAELTAGRHTQIRLEISEAWGIQASDGAQENITVTTGTARVVQSFQILANETTQIVVDLDLDRSVRAQGPPHDPHEWRMTPVIGRTIVAEGIAGDPREDVPDPDA